MFKKGDIVKCVDDDNVTTVKAGNYYEVLAVKPGNATTAMLDTIKVRGDNGCIVTQADWRFRRAKKAMLKDAEGTYKVQVIFSNSGDREYTYACDLEDLEVGDYVLVPAAYYNANGRIKYNSARVVAIIYDEPASTAHVKILQKIDTSELDKAEERRLEKERLQKELQAMRKDVEIRAKEAALQYNAKQILETAGDTIGLRMLEQIDSHSRRIAELD